MEKIVYLKKVPLFSHLSIVELKKILRITKHKFFKKNEIILSENEKGDRLYIIMSGMVKIFRTSSTGKAKKTLAILKKGDFLGEMAILNREVRSASAQTLDDTDLLILTRKDFNGILRNNPELPISIMATLAARLRDADRQIGTLTFQNMLGRVAVSLVDLSQRHGVEKPGGIEIGLNLTHQEIADMVGTAREMITKILNRFKRSGCIKFENKRITILDIDKIKGWIY